LIGRISLTGFAVVLDLEDAILVADPIDDARADHFSSGISYILYFNEDEPALTAMTFAISRAALSICEEHYETFLAWVKEGDTLDVFSSRVLDHFLSHPESTLFLINYSAASSHLVKDDGAFQRHYAFAVAHFDLLEPYFGKRKESEEFLLWSSYFRRLLMDAQFVLSGLYNDVASYREMSQKIAVSGIKAFRKEGN
jgi:hypothetical protein